MAGMGRTGRVYDIEIDPQLLVNAFNNTVQILKNQVEVPEQ
jgi:hypothetical protein